MNITEKTTVPLFVVIAAVVAGMSGIGGHLLWIAAISSKAESAAAENLIQNSHLIRQDSILLEIRDRGIRSEEKLDLLLREKK
jgi:hypothetical protein